MLDLTGTTITDAGLKELQDLENLQELNLEFRKDAIEEYRSVANDKDLAQPYRDLATIRLTSLEFDQIKPEEVIARMEPLAKAGNPWFGSAGELTAMAMLKQGKKSEAGRMFAAMAADNQAPNTIRSRALRRPRR